MLRRQDRIMLRLFYFPLFKILHNIYPPVFAPVTITVFPNKHTWLRHHPVVNLMYNLITTNTNTIEIITNILFIEEYQFTIFKYQIE